jgi:hypothetical protein
MNLVDEMGSRIDDLERSISELMEQVGILCLACSLLLFMCCRLGSMLMLQKKKKVGMGSDNSG